MKECCPAMELVLQRVRDTDKLGLMREQMLIFNTGTVLPGLVLRIHSDRKNPGAWVELNFCPFCGKPVNSEIRRKQAAAARVARSATAEPKGDNTTHRTRSAKPPAPGDERGGYVRSPRPVRNVSVGDIRRNGPTGTRRKR
jgi:hypothetical protein